jgi:hypothetical protein
MAARGRLWVTPTDPAMCAKTELVRGPSCATKKGEGIELTPRAHGTASRPHRGSARNQVTVDDGAGPPIIERKRKRALERE